MNYFLSEDTITKCFNQLKDQNYSNENRSILFQFLLLKHAGFDTLDYLDLGSQDTKRKIFEAADKFAAIIPGQTETKDKKYNFINPLRMDKWDVSEPLYKWTQNRLKNNILGGGQNWKQIYELDENNQNKIIERNNGISKIFDTSQKFPVELLAIWFFRFDKFSNQLSISKLINGFYEFFNISQEEKNQLFSNEVVVPVNYSDKVIEPSLIRKLIIGINEPPKSSDWSTEFSNIDNTFIDTIQHKSFTNIKREDLSTPTISSIQSLLDDTHQVILMGPPGTSKSFIANEIAKQYNDKNVLHLQFHPQYTYQDFIGGQILKNGNLLDKKGEFISFLEKAQKIKSEKFLLIIDELNRANVSQIFGELIQILDRDQSIYLEFDNKREKYQLPSNFNMICTMNTTDRTVGRLDLALKRRFYQVYCGVNYSILIDKVQIEDNSFSIAEFLKKINTSLISVLNNKEMVIGHASFLKTKQNKDHIFIWTKKDFYNLFNYLILPIITDYCNDDDDLIQSVLGSLSQPLTPAKFYNKLQDFLS